jgi:hypothetical protein
MKKILVSFSLFIALQGPIFAALPPLWQGVQELKVILADKRLGDYLDAGDAITSVKKVDEGWIIITTKKRVTVRLTYDNTSKAGPVQFRISFLEG